MAPDELSRRVFGVLVTAMSAGGVVGALLYTAVATRVRRHTAFVVALLGTSIPVLVVTGPLGKKVGIIATFFPRTARRVRAPARAKVRPEAV